MRWLQTFLLVLPFMDLKIAAPVDHVSDRFSGAGTHFRPSPYLPPLLYLQNGSKVTSPELWNERRAELKRLLQEHLIGSLPSHDDIAFVSAGTLNSTSSDIDDRRTVNRFLNLTFSCCDEASNTMFSFTIELIEPNDEDLKPAFLTQWSHREWAVSAVSRGYRGIVYPASDELDAAPLLQSVFTNATMGLIAARALVGMLTLDYVMTLKRVLTDQIAVAGHSRNGKQSLIFAAFDERVSSVVGSSPGAPIASPYRFTSSNFYGEGPRTGGVTCRSPGKVLSMCRNHIL